jgi:tetratricopeptide (TPR) repeat protein
MFITILLSALTAIMGNSLIFGQSGTTGAAEGFIKDAKTGEVVSKAKVKLVYIKNEIVKYELQSDKKGHFYKGALTPGIYRYSVEKEGYMPVVGSIRVRLADTVEINIELKTVESTIPVSVKTAQKAMKLFEQSQYENAIKEFSEVISENQSNPLLYFYRGWAQEKNGNIEGALEDYQKAIELKPDFILPYSRAGTAYAKQQSYEKASEFYQKSVELGDQDITTHYNYGVVLMNLGKSEAARPVFENLLSLDENYSDAYYHLGIIYIGLGDVTKAKEFLQKFVDMDPENSNAPIAKKILESLK